MKGETEKQRGENKKKKGGERERVKKKMGDYGGTAGPGIAGPRCTPKGKITMVGESTVANCQKAAKRTVRGGQMKGI